MLRSSIFLICFLFALASKADDDPVSETETSTYTSECHDQFADANTDLVESSAHGTNITPLQTRTTTDWYEHLKKTIVQASFKEELQSEQQFNARWKKDVLESLPILDPVQIVGSERMKTSGLVEGIVDVVKNNNSILLSEQEFFQALVDGITEIIPQFSRENLMDIMYFFQKYHKSELDPEPKLDYKQFARAWRKRALELRAEFTFDDRYGAANFFRRLGIPPLKKPNDLDSGNMEFNPEESSSRAASSR